MIKSIKKVFTLCCVLMLTLFVFAKPTLAADFPSSSYASASYNNPKDFLEQCFFSQPDSGIGEVLCSVGKDGAKAVIVYAITTGVCYVVDGAAANAFPPAIALAPLCNEVGSAAATLTGGRLIGKVIAP